MKKKVGSKQILTCPWETPHIYWPCIWPVWGLVLKDLVPRRDLPTPFSACSLQGITPNYRNSRSSLICLHRRGFHHLSKHAHHPQVSFSLCHPSSRLPPRFWPRQPQTCFLSLCISSKFLELCVYIIRITVWYWRTNPGSLH